MATMKRKQFLAVAAAIMAGALALPTGAQAQFFGGGWGFQQPYRAAPPSNGFSFPFFGRRRAYAPPAESYRAPPPRKPETPPSSTVIVVGDSMADWLAYGLEEVYADNQQIGVVRSVRTYSGLVRYEPRNEALQWPQAVKDALATEKPSAIVVMLGLNDRIPLRERAAPAAAAAKPAPQAQDGKSAPQAAAGAEQKPEERPADPRHPGPIVSYEFRSDQWAQAYKKRIDEMITVLKSKGAPVIWVGLPAIRGPRATSDISYLDDLYHAEADKLGITYVDIWDGFVDEDGRYVVQGPDFEGQIRRLRTGDGVHFTKYGALKLAHLVDQDLSRLMANPTAPVALPSPQAAAPAKPGTVRAAVGPVLPLTATGGGGQMINSGEAASLLGAGSHAPVASEDPTAKSALVRGDPLAAPPGRADNFAWPAGDAAANAAPQAAPAAQ